MDLLEELNELWYGPHTNKIQCLEQLMRGNETAQTPLQIGFIEIWGKKYPVFKGINKIGRIAGSHVRLTVGAISREHAELIVRTEKDFILMDLNSANGTKVSGISLKPRIPHTINNGDMVQFGDVFGIFRVLAED